jgi:hypothetical protein
MFDKALFDVETEQKGEWRDGVMSEEGVDPAILPSLRVCEISSKDYKILDVLLKQIGKIIAQIEAFKKIEQNMKAFGVVRAKKEKTIVPSISDLIDKILRQYPKEYIRKNIGPVTREAIEEHRIKDRPDYEYDRKAYYDAVYHALSRRVAKK